jgi:hypothetical protein
MKKVLMLAAILLGTTVMVNAQTEPAKTAPAKEVKHTKKKEKKAEPAKAAAVETPAPAKAKK